MEEQEPLAAKLEERSEAGERDLHSVQVGTVGEFLTREGPPPIKEEPVEGLHQCWESQWQKFLKTVESPEKGQESPAQPAEDTKEFQDALKQAASQWLGGACRTPSPARLSGDAPGTYGNPNVKVKEEIVDEEDADLEMQQHFCGQEDRSPREVLLQFQELWYQWLWGGRGMGSGLALAHAEEILGSVGLRKAPLLNPRTVAPKPFWAVAPLSYWVIGCAPH